MSEYIPGVLVCKKCKFRLYKRTFYVNQNTIAVNNAPDKCPNCETPLWRVTYKDDYNKILKENEKYTNQNTALKAENEALKESIKLAYRLCDSDQEVKVMKVLGSAIKENTDDTNS